MTDRYAETDEWPTPHVTAQNRTLPASRPEKGSTDADAATVARRDRYAEAIEAALRIKRARWSEPTKTQYAAVAVMAVADEELAALRDAAQDAEWVLSTDHGVGRHDHYGENLTCKGCKVRARLRALLASSQAATTGEADEDDDTTGETP